MQTTRNGLDGSCAFAAGRMPEKLSQMESGEEVRFSTGIGELDRVLGGGIVVFTDGKKLVTLLHSLICPTAHEQQGNHTYGIYVEADFSHTLNITESPAFYCLMTCIERYF